MTPRSPFAHLTTRASAINSNPSTGEHYRVWAPPARRLELEIGGDRLPMVRRPNGWWVADRQMRDGELYAYAVDGQGPFPDPRSMFQPAGVHGPSQVVDHSRFEWSDARWQPPPLAAAVLYEMQTGHSRRLERSTERSRSCRISPV